MKTPLDQITISTNLGNRRFVNELRRHQETNPEINFSRLCIGLMRDDGTIERDKRKVGVSNYKFYKEYTKK